MAVPEPEDIRAWQRLDEKTTTSGRLEDGDVARLAAIGTRYMINLALDDHLEALPDEAAKLAAVGIGHTHIPIPFDAPREEHYEAFGKALDAAPGPVHVHCIMNWRVSAFFYRRHREAGMPERKARSIMRRQWDPREVADPRAAAWARLIGD